jgi:SAM-dependent methyltransferase
MNLFPVDFRLESGIWIPPKDESIPYTDGDSVEAYLEKTLMEAGDLSYNSPELMGAIKDWPSLYHLSPERPNLLRGLEIDPESHVLELGCGCGAITRYLGENARRVIAVEGSTIRAKIAKLRCRDLDNVDVIATNFDHIEFSNKFDVVTLIGVLEYADIFWRKGEDPFSGLLNLASRYLKDNGMLVIAIENKLGMKYLSGCSEDHLARHFIGVEGYPGDRGPRTFGKIELQELLLGTGFSDVDILLPFPDYKLPSTMINAKFTSPGDWKAYNLADWCRQPFLDYSREREVFFCDPLALASMASNGLLADFANSFLLVAAKSSAGPESPIRHPDWIAKRFNMYRKPEYQTVTSLQIQDGQPRIIKELQKPAQQGTDAVLHRIPASMGFMLKARSLSLEMLRALRSEVDAAERFSALVAEWITYLRRHLLTGTDLLPPRFIDCVPENLIYDGNNVLQYIDDEWHWHEPIPMDWPVFRGLMVFWLHNKIWIRKALMSSEYRFADYITVSLKSSGISISDARLEQLAALETRFQKEVTIFQPPDYDSLLSSRHDDLPALDQLSKYREMKSDYPRLRDELAWRNRQLKELVEHSEKLQQSINSFSRYRELAEKLITDKDAAIAEKDRRLQFFKRRVDAQINPIKVTDPGGN